MALLNKKITSYFEVNFQKFQIQLHTHFILAESDALKKKKQESSESKEKSRVIIFVWPLCGHIPALIC